MNSNTIPAHTPVDELAARRSRDPAAAEGVADATEEARSVAGQQNLVEMIARGAPLPQVLAAIARFIEQQTEGTCCSIVLLQGDLLRRGAAPSMPPSFQDALDGLIVGPRCGSCGTAAFTGQQVISINVAADPLWEGYSQWLIDNYGMHACWATPIVGSGGKVLGVFSMYRKTTGEPGEQDRSLIDTAVRFAGWAIERWHLDEELRHARDVAESASRAKSLFFANMGHELRTPLAAILGYTDLIDEDFQSGNVDGLRADLANIKRAATQLQTLVSNVLDVTRLDAGQVKPQLAAFDAFELLDRVAGKAARACERKNNRFRFECAEALGEIISDSSLIERILDVLIDNANKFTSDGQLVMRAARSAADGEDRLEISVSDTGIGMNAQQLDNLSQIFFLGDPTSTRRHGGSGLGLAVAYGVCRLIGGSIDVQSEVGRGTTFRVNIPASSP